MPTAKTRPTLTETKLRNCRPETGILYSTNVSGLSFEPSTSNPKMGSFYLRFTHPTTGKRARFRLGRYPELSLAGAEQQARELHAAIAEGRAPADVVADAKRKAAAEQAAAEAAAAQTLERILRDYHARQAAAGVWKNAKFVKGWISSLEIHVFPKIGLRPIAELRARELYDVLFPIWHAKPETARKLLERINTGFELAEALGILEHNPIPAVKRLLGRSKQAPEEQRHYPAMPWRDVPRFVAEVLLQGKATAGKHALLFAILTAARSGAVRHAEWSEFDLDAGLWTIPGYALERKITGAHTMPLARQTVELLRMLYSEARESDTVFAAHRVNAKGNWALSDMTLTKHLKMHAERFPSTTPGRVCTVHGFRSAFKDWATETGYDDLLSEIQLTHQVGDRVRRAYARTQAVEQRREMVQAWADFCFSEVELEE